jgi:putative ABC transport system ATP-binding protein
LRQIADEGHVVVVATHDERIVPLADKIVALSPRPEERGVISELQLAAGDTLFEQGDESDVVYVVDVGEIELVRVRADGGEDILARHGPGEYFGELGPMFGIRRSATARAITPVHVTGLPLREFRSRFRAEKASDLVAQGP